MNLLRVQASPQSAVAGTSSRALDEQWLKPDLSPLREAVASLQLLVTQGAEEWRAAIAEERASRSAANAALEAIVSRESKEHSCDLDELADDVREQVGGVANPVEVYYACRGIHPLATAAYGGVCQNYEPRYLCRITAAGQRHECRK